MGLSGPPTGVHLMDWSFDSAFLATKCESMPNVVWIWDLTTLQLSTVLIHINAVKSFKFAPQSHQLVIGTGQSRVFCWTPKGACVIDLPRNEAATHLQVCLSVNKVMWNPRGTNLFLSDKSSAILAFPSSDMLTAAPHSTFFKQPV